MNSPLNMLAPPPIGRHFIPCCGQRLQQQPVVLIHGWGADSQIWGDLPQELSQWADIITLDLPGFGHSASLSDYSPDSLLNWMHRALPDQCLLLGLSLGGMLCQHYAAAYPQQVTGLILLSSNRQFVADADYETAMPQAEFDGFLHSWHTDPHSCLKRFASLQAQGDRHQRQLTRQLRVMEVSIDPGAAGALLGLLGQLKNQQQCPSLPSLSLFGEYDALVPAQAASHRANSVIIEGAGHLPHLSAPQQVVQQLQVFLEAQRYQLDKPRVAQSFGRAASSYDRAAQLQHRIGDRLLQQLKNQPVYPPPAAPSHIVDLGCGTGYHSIQLQQQYPEATVLGVDLSGGMLAYASAKYQQTDLGWLCADAENLSLQSDSQALIFSNFALQWCSCLDTLAAELHRVLQPSGQLLLAVPGPETLTELRQAWAQVDDQVHINRFASLQQWQQALANAGFSFIQLTSEPVVEQHRSVRELLLELKQVGAHNSNAGKSATITGKQRLKALYNAYEHFRLPSGELPATWEIISGLVSK